MSNLPDGCTQAALDRYYDGYGIDDDSDDETPDDEREFQHFYSHVVPGGDDECPF